MLRVHSIETFGVHDGPGIRLVIFLQGCNAHCVYCHNPDSQVCAGGEMVSVADIVSLVERQKEYLKDGGGVTFSGGEPTLQAKELVGVCRELKKIGVNIALDTNGTIDSQEVRDLYGLVDLLLLDVKHINDNWHRKITGLSNANVLKMAEYREKLGLPMWLRYVLVPGYSDQEEYLEQFGQYFKEYKMIEKVELLPFHTAGAYKYEELGWENPLEGVDPASSTEVAKAKEILEKYFRVVG